MNRRRLSLRASVPLVAALLSSCSGEDASTSPNPNTMGGTSQTSSGSSATVAGAGMGPNTSASNTAASVSAESAATHASTSSTSGGTTSPGTTSPGTTSTGTNSADTATSSGGGSSTQGSSDTSGGGSGGTGNTPTGGASASAVCTPGASYGDPLAGMGQVQEIAAPQSSYFAFIEGPVWVGSLGTLYFSDNASSPAERIWKLVPPSTTPEIFMEESGSNGLAIDGDDQLILADQRNQQITRVDSTSAALQGTLVGPGNYKPNDIIVRSDGNIYFTDPATGFYHLTAAGELSAANKGVSSPNGVVLSTDENTLYVGDVNNRQIHAFPLEADGSVGSGSLFVTAQNQTVDGMAVDCAGNLYAGTANGVEVFSPTAEPLGIVPTGESSNATFGGSDRKTLYVTSRAVLKYVTLAVPGLPD